ncbi:MAG: thiamine pyrophosphate-dependent enzyme [Acidobacteriaceae bacterium]
MATKVRGLAKATLNSSHQNPLISNAKLRQLYSVMLKCRLLERRAQILRKRAGLEGDHHSSLGLEATAVGAAIDLRPTDTLAPSHRDFILGYLKGVPLTALFSQLQGSNASPHNGRSAADDSEYGPLNIVLPASTFATQLTRCIDIARVNQREKNANVVVAFSGGGSTSLGEWLHTLNFAGKRSLPIVFVRHQSNLSAGPGSANLEGMGNGTSSEVVEYGFPGIAVDGNDAIAVYRVAQEAIERARSGGGPTLIEAQTLPGNEPAEMNRGRSRSVDDVEESESSDPISAMEPYLIGKGLFSRGWKKEIVAEFQQELDAAVGGAEYNSCRVSA